MSWLRTTVCPARSFIWSRAASNRGSAYNEAHAASRWPRSRQPANDTCGMAVAPDDGVPRTNERQVVLVEDSGTISDMWALKCSAIGGVVSRYRRSS